MKYILPYSDFLSLNEAVGTALKTFVEPGLITPDEWSTIQTIDPSRGKFSVPLIKWYLQTRDLPIIGRYIQNFWKLKNQNILKGVDLNKYSDFKDFTLLVDVYKYSAKTQAYKKFGEPRYEILQDDENIFLVRINNLAASVYFGDENGWCIGDTKTYTVSDHWKDYMDNDAVIYFIYNKREPYDSRFKKILTAAFFDKTYEIRGIGNKPLGPNPLSNLQEIKVNISLLKGISLINLDLSRFSPTQIEFIKKFGFNKHEVNNMEVKNGILDLPELVIPISNLEKLDALKNLPNDIKVSKNIIINAEHADVFLKSLLSYYNILKDYNIDFINTNSIHSFNDFHIETKNKNDIEKLKNLNINYKKFANIIFDTIKGIKTFDLFSFLNIHQKDIPNIFFNDCDFEYLNIYPKSVKSMSIYLRDMPNLRKIDINNTLINEIIIFDCPKIDDSEIEKLKNAGYPVKVNSFD